MRANLLLANGKGGEEARESEEGGGGLGGSRESYGISAGRGERRMGGEGERERGDSFLISMKIAFGDFDDNALFRCFKCKSTKGKTVRAL